MTSATSYSRKSWFTYRIVCTRMVMEGGEVVVTIALVCDTVERKVRGQTEHLHTCQNEGQRVEALRKWFGVEEVVWR